MTMPPLVCRRCGATHPVESLAWRCDCGGVLDVLDNPAALSFTAGQQARNSLWRYESVLPVPFDEQISLGEGMSPIVRSRTQPNVRLKLDFLMPTLSFKDRGAVVLATLASALGVRSALTDSSGNAGTAAAAYLARAGIPCRVFVPEATSPAKLAQIRAHGAEITLVAGTRADTAAAAREMASQPGIFYASHVFHPYFAHGVKTYGYEIWEQSGGLLPDTVVVPAGNGTLVLGCHLAFRELVEAGLADRMPTLVAVQAARLRARRRSIPIRAAGCGSGDRHRVDGRGGDRHRGSAPWRPDAGGHPRFRGHGDDGRRRRDSGGTSRTGHRRPLRGTHLGGVLGGRAARRERSRFRGCGHPAVRSRDKGGAMIAGGNRLSNIRRAEWPTEIR